MNRHDAALSCRAYATIFPGLKGPLQDLELRFLRQAMFENVKPDAPGRSLNMRRLEVVRWPDLHAQFREAARQQELGLEPDLTPLNKQLLKLVADFEDEDQQVNVAGDGADLRHAAALSKTNTLTGIEGLPSWTRLLGERDPRTWSQKRIKRVMKEMQQQRKLINNHGLDEILYMDFLARISTRFGNLIWMLWIPSSFPESSFYWKRNTHGCQNLTDEITSAIIATQTVNEKILRLLLHYPNIWRDLGRRDALVEASITSVINIINACLAPIHRLYINPKEAETFVVMNQGVTELENRLADLLRDIDANFPGRVDFELKCRDDMNVFEAVRIPREINLGPCLTFWDRIFGSSSSRGQSTGAGSKPYQIAYLMEIYGITPATRRVNIDPAPIDASTSSRLPKESWAQKAPA